MTCRPGHAPKHPDFEAGNTAAERHGAHSERRWRPIAEELAAAIVADCPWLARPAFRAATWAWAVAEAQAQLVDRYLDEHGWSTDDEAPDALPRSATGWSDRLHRRAAHLRSALGLDPGSMARLLAAFAGGVPGGEDALAALRAEGARIIAARGVDVGSEPARAPLTAAEGQAAS